MLNMTVSLDENSGKNLYEQIYEHIKREIIEGKLSYMDKLPSSRSLAENLGVSRNTVDAAYSQLISEGYIEAVPCRGYYVAEYEVDLQKLTPGEKDEPEAVVKAPVNISNDNSNVIDFSPFKIDLEAFPITTWRRITHDIINYSNNSLFLHGSHQGDMDLRVSIAGYIRSARGVLCNPEQIIIGAGNDYLLMLLDKILGNRRKVGMDNPTYMRAYNIFQSFGDEIHTFDIEGRKMTAAVLEEENIDTLYVMPSNQFPTGAVMPIQKRAELLKWAASSDDRYIIEDDYDSEFRYKGKPIPSLQSMDELQKVIYLGSFSKAIAPAIRISYMVLPEILCERFRAHCDFYSCTVSRIDQRILNEFIKGGYFEKHLNRMRKKYRAKHDALIEALKPFRTDFEITGVEGGLHVVLTDLRNRREETLIESARKAGIKVYGMGEYVPCGKTNANTAILLGFGGLSSDEIKQGTDLLLQAWKI